MTNTRIYFFVVFAMMLSVYACKKETIAPEPEIAFVSASPLVVTQFKDSIEVVISYKDNTGDIGDESANEFSLAVKDSRLAHPDFYHIQPLTPDNKKLKIEGELKIKINTMFLLGTGTTETTILTIKLKDREGNWSNEIKTPVITIQ